MKVKTWIKYTEEFIPPRCRKPRYKEKEDYVDIDLKEVDRSLLQRAYRIEDTILWLYNGILYRPAISSDISSFDIEDPIENLKFIHKNCSTYFGFDPGDTRLSMKMKAVNDMKKYLLAGGELLVKSFLPCYNVMTFGMNGHNGDVYLSVSYVKEITSGYYAPDQYDEAVQHAIDLAVRRNNLHSIPDIKSTKRIVIY